jgi:hypothetical protein
MSLYDDINRLAPQWPRDAPRGDARGWVAKRSKSAGRGQSHSIAAGSEVGPENPLKVETRVQIPLGLRRSGRVTIQSGSLFPRLSRVGKRLREALMRCCDGLPSDPWVDKPRRPGQP